MLPYKSYKKVFNTVPFFRIKRMKDFFYMRTMKHKNYVKEFVDKVINHPDFNFLDLDVLRHEGEIHDDSKFRKPEYAPYVFLTWYHKCRNEGKEFVVTEYLKKSMDKASFYHITTNKHHPEYWCGKKDMENSHIMNVETMPLEYIAAMICDWMAMSKELNNCPYDWTDKNVNIKWRFSEKQFDLIYKILDLIWVK